MSLREALDRCRREVLIRTLAAYGGNRTQAAKELRVTRGYVCRLLRRYRIKA